MDPTTPPQAAPVAAQGTNAPGGPPVTPVVAARPLADVERDLTEARRQAAQYREDLRKYEAAQAVADQTRAAQETAALVEQQKFKELYEASERKATEAAQKQAAAERKALIAQVAQETGLPAKAWDRVQGDDETAIRKDITENLLPLMVAPPAPIAPRGGLPTNTGRTPPTLTPPVAPFDPKSPPRLSQPGLFKTT